MVKFTRNISALIALIILLPFWADGQPIDRTKYKADSLAMEAYRVSISECITQPISLKMADTLFLMAKKLNIPRRQSLALSYKVDYYYSRNNIDSLSMAVDEVQKFTKEHNIPVHYYFSWYRKINLLIIIGQLNTAISEAGQMLADAKESGYIPAQVDGYKLMGRLYLKKKLMNEAYESYKAAIEICENAPPDVDIQNKYYPYFACAYVLQGTDKVDEMAEFLDKALLLATSPAQKVSIYTAYCNNKIMCGDLDKAEQYLNMAKALKPDMILVGGLGTILDTEIKLAIAQKDGHKAIALLDSLKNHDQFENSIHNNYANAYAVIGDYKKAYIHAQLALSLCDSVAITDMRNDISEMIVLNEVNKLKAEKDKQELDLKSQKLLYTRIILVGAVLVLIVISIFMHRFLKLNRKLTKSENNLKQAVVKLEEESKVKADFLHHLSHEIRTPLNALVGFCSVLIESNPPSEKNNKYGNIIQTNSDMIIKFVTDAIDITNSSNIGQTEEVDINSCFDSALEYSPIKFAKDVVLKFEPYRGSDSVFSINKEKVVRILYNLIHNSAKFTKEGQITVGAEVDTTNRTISYTVTDTGMGIPKNMHGYVFEYFTKINSMSQGLGLGLPLSRYLAELMGGSLTIDDSYTNGCRFVLNFPY